MKYPNAVAITGFRRCGKSTLSISLFKNKKYYYVTLDDERFININSKNLNDILIALYEIYGDIEYLIFDEIENIKEFELFISRLRDTKKIIITGSNSKLLSGELSKYLTGRHIDFELYPFSFREFLLFKKFNIRKDSIYSTEEKSKIMKYIQEYFDIGGFPEAIKFGKLFLSTIYSDIIYRDILYRYNIRKIDDIKKIALYIISNFSNEMSYNKFEDIFKMNNRTVKNYLDYIFTSYLVFKINPFSYKLKDQYKSFKVYCTDHALGYSIGFSPTIGIGKQMENIVAIELKRRMSYDIDNKYQLYYWKDYNNREIDFLIYNSNEKNVYKLINVSHISDYKEINQREIKSLIIGSRLLNCDNIEIITNNYEKNDGNIKYTPLWKWLLDND